MLSRSATGKPDFHEEDPRGIGPIATTTSTLENLLRGKRMRAGAPPEGYGVRL